MCDLTGRVGARSLAAFAAAITLLAGSVAGAQTGTIHGRVELPPDPAAQARRPNVGDLGMPAALPPVSRRPSVVYLETAPRGAFEERRSGRATMDQRNETFVPQVLAVAAGTVIDFPNNDETYHNVFSLSRTQPFDLGRYPAGRSRSVRFDRTGIVRVFCDIHSHMSAFILVFGHQFFAVTDDGGRYEITGVPPGVYTVTVWNEVPRESRQIRIPEAGGQVELDFVLTGAVASARRGEDRENAAIPAPRDSQSR